MNPFKILFLGTPNIASQCLDFLIHDKQFTVEAVFTKPDARKGRGLKLSPSPVKELAIKNNISVFTPITLSSPKDIEFLKTESIDGVIVVAYGMILPSFFLDLFPKKIVNIHASLLPRWRGATPIQSSLLAGDKKTGVTLQQVVKKLDAGDIIDSKEILIEDTMDSLYVLKKMELMSIALLKTSLPRYFSNQITPHSQNELNATYCRKIKNEDLKINWNENARSIFNHIRAYTMNGGSYTFYKNKRLKIFKSSVNLESNFAEGKYEGVQEFPGKVMGYSKEKGLLISCGEGSLFVLEVQFLGKRKQGIHHFMMGARISKGEKFGQ